MTTDTVSQDELLAQGFRAGIYAMLGVLYDHQQHATQYHRLRTGDPEVSDADKAKMLRSRCGSIMMMLDDMDVDAEADFAREVSRIVDAYDGQHCHERTARIVKHKSFDWYALPNLHVDSCWVFLP